MGQVYMGPPQELVLRLQEAGGLTQFIETGTYQGHTARWAATCFDRVVTIEYAKELWEAAKAKWGRLTNVEFVWGDSRRLLRSLVPGLSRPAVFWLDAHWSGGDTYGQGDECPLLAELEVIVDSPAAHCILIDDARLFTAAPPAPHVPGQWPTLAEIVAIIGLAGPAYAVAVVDDVIVVVPDDAREVLERYGREEAAEYRPLERQCGVVAADSR